MAIFSPASIRRRVRRAEPNEAFLKAGGYELLDPDVIQSRIDDLQVLIPHSGSAPEDLGFVQRSLEDLSTELDVAWKAAHHRGSRAIQESGAQWLVDFGGRATHGYRQDREGGVATPRLAQLRRVIDGTSAPENAEPGWKISTEEGLPKRLPFEAATHAATHLAEVNVLISLLPQTAGMGAPTEAFEKMLGDLRSSLNEVIQRAGTEPSRFRQEKNELTTERLVAANGIPMSGAGHHSEWVIPGLRHGGANSSHIPALGRAFQTVLPAGTVEAQMRRLTGLPTKSSGPSK